MSIALTLFLLPLCVRAQTADCLLVRGDRITAGELAAGVPAFRFVAPNMPLLPAPAPGARRIVHQSELERLAARLDLAAPGADPINADICVRRESSILIATELTLAMIESLPAGSEIELLDFSRYPVPDGRVTFPLSGLAAAPSGQPHRPVLWRGFVRNEGGRTSPVWARVRLSRTQASLVAIHDLRAGSTIQASDVTIEQRRTFALQKPAPAIERVVNQTPRRLIRAGEAVTASLLAPGPDLRSGQELQVEVYQGSVRLSLLARAETAGRTGGRVWMRSVESGRRFLAQVTGPGRVEIRQDQQEEIDSGIKMAHHNSDVHAGSRNKLRPTAQR